MEINSVWYRLTSKSIARGWRKVPPAERGGYCWVYSSYGFTFNKGMDEMDTWMETIKVGQVTALYNSKGKQQDIL